MKRPLLPMLLLAALPLAGCTAADHHHHATSHTQKVDDVYDAYRGRERIDREEQVRRRLLEERGTAQ